jgi:hypothetical protein
MCSRVSDNLRESSGHPSSCGHYAYRRRANDRLRGNIAGSARPILYDERLTKPFR